MLKAKSILVDSDVSAAVVGTSLVELDPSVDLNAGIGWAGASVDTGGAGAMG